MKPFGNALLLLVGGLAGAGFFLGVLAAVLGLLLAHGSDGIAGLVERIYLLEAIALPAALALTYWLILDQPDSRDLYASLPLSLLAALLAAVLGAAAAALTFLLPAVNGPIILAGLDATTFSAAVWSRIFPTDFILVLALTTLLSLALSLLTTARSHTHPPRPLS